MSLQDWNQHAFIFPLAMVILTLTHQFNKWLGPFLLRQGLSARSALGRGVIHDNPTLDSVLLLPLAQKLVSLEVHHDGQRAVREGQLRDSWLTGLFSARKKQENSTESLDESELRVRVLERYLRPALVPRENWADVRKWQFHHRLLKWARTEFLLAKHQAAVRAAFELFPDLPKSTQLAVQKQSFFPSKVGKDIDPGAGETVKSKIPSATLVKTAFGMHHWSEKKNVSASSRNMRRWAKSLNGEVIELKGGLLRFAYVPDNDASVKQLSLEQILELAGGHVSSCGPLNAICEEYGIYQLWTREYIEYLGEYLVGRAGQFDGETVVLDVGAGDGLLVKFLQEFLTHGSAARPIQRRPAHHARRVRPSTPRAPAKVPITLVAIDDGSWQIKERAIVQKVSVQDALSSYPSTDTQQVIVLCSWMPMNEDWSALFRAAQVSEYILIGECDDGQCGDNWETWGNHKCLLNVDESELIQDLTGTSIKSTEPGGRDTKQSTESMRSPPYLVDGYRRKDLVRLSPFQFSRFDSADSKFGKTVSFRRQ